MFGPMRDRDDLIVAEDLFLAIKDQLEFPIEQMEGLILDQMPMLRV